MTLGKFLNRLIFVKLARHEGLVWVLRDLMKKEANITYDNFPDFLDMKSRSHLMQVG